MPGVPGGRGAGICHWEARRGRVAALSWRSRVSDELTIGTHRLLVDGDTVLTRYIGVPEYAHVREIHGHFDRVLAEHGRLFVINDMRRSGIPGTATRKWITEWVRQHTVAGLVNFGASLPVRALQTLIFRASALLGQRNMVEAVHCGSEAEAFAWVAARRRQLT